MQVESDVQTRWSGRRLGTIRGGSFDQNALTASISSMLVIAGVAASQCRRTGLQVVVGEFLVPTFTLEASEPPCTFRGWSVRSDSVPWVSDSVRIVQQVAVLEISDPPLDGFAMALKL